MNTNNELPVLDAAFEIGEGFPFYFTGIYKDEYNHRWFKDGLLHREDGPALECSDGTKYYYIQGVEYSKKIYWFLTLTYLQKGLLIPEDLVKKYKL